MRCPYCGATPCREWAHQPTPFLGPAVDLSAPPVEPDPVERPDSEGGTFSPSGPSGPGAPGHYFGAVDLSVVLLGGGR